MHARIDQVGRAFALLVGVNDYSVYDASRGLPAGTNDLPAGRNDVGAFYRMCRALGVPHENIHVLTSPKLQPGDVGEPGEQIPCGYLGEATGAEIRKQLAWLADALSHAPGDADEPIGLFTYSGHGDFAGGHLALCPSDVHAPSGSATLAPSGSATLAPSGSAILAADGAAPDLQGVLGFPEIQAIFQGRPGRGDNLTVVLDCCHAAAAQGAPGASTKRRPGASLTGRGRSSGAESAEVHVFGGRMLMAAAPGELAYQSKFDGHDHGALTWALNVVADQWLVQSEGDVDDFTIDHGTLLERSQQILRALGFAQTLKLYPDTAAHLLFFHRGAADASDVAAKAPDRARHGIQVDPTWLGGLGGSPDWVLYTFTDVTNAELGAILAVNVGWGSYASGTEYWNIPQSLSTATNMVATNGYKTSPPSFPVTKDNVYAMTTSTRTYGGWEQDNAVVPPSTTLWGVSSTTQNPFGFWVDWTTGPTWYWVELTVEPSSSAYAVAGSSSVVTSTMPTQYGGLIRWTLKATATLFSNG